MPITSEQVLELFEQINGSRVVPTHAGRSPRGCSSGRMSTVWPPSRTRRATFSSAFRRRKGLAHAPTVVLQGHMDMVCEKTPDSTHNFETDPIPLVTTASGSTRRTRPSAPTTASRSRSRSPSPRATYPHPPLEILVTVDEETGLTGAQTSRRAGSPGPSSSTSTPRTRACSPSAAPADAIRSSRCARPGAVARGARGARARGLGLQGGHSGVDIHLGRANANVLLVRALRGRATRYSGTSRLASRRQRAQRDPARRLRGHRLPRRSARQLVEVEIARELDTFRPSTARSSPRSR